MATFGSVKTIATTTDSSIYTAGTNGSLLIGLFIANKSSSDATITITCGGKYIAFGIAVPEATTVNVIDGRIFMSASEELLVLSSSDDSLDVVLSYMEL